jgi:hypothetical protein
MKEGGKVIMQHRRLIEIIWFLLICQCTSAQPLIQTQPRNTSVSLAGTAQFSVYATSTNPPVAYQWWSNETALDVAANPSAVKSVLYFTNNRDGTLSRTWTHDLSQMTAEFASVAWVDLDNDGWLDLFVVQFRGSQPSRLFRNRGDGTFEEITTGSPVSEATGYASAWGDYDNDGFLDLCG